ncbi:hypothetical protein LSGJ_00106 [Ligilactobacillus salivarius GJ-24]|uniref:Type I restriction modification DNA specificity domain-containing protein n=1 Tax=Ligilactobacillus salivarius GJ-24 TaxID=1041521 RepID=F7QS22_9LACO|nr:restriction endonuclease subunit S [Ligilactobacillus salivarius]EGM52716.1 hypothetical protein LSGJ_00106 [Ligilactobacillus salivarius GJ-24]
MDNKKNGIPKLRFPGFTGAWEQRKLGEVVKITMGQSPSSKNYTDNSSDYILVQGNADMKNGRVVPRVWTTQITRQAEKGDLILSVRAPVGDIGKTDYDVVIGRGVAAIKGNEYIFQILTKMNNSGYWTRFSTGSTFESINSSNIRNAQIMIPKDDEQTKIGHFLSRFDSLIALHQRKLEHLQEQKKGLLQKMFPKNGETVPEVRFPGFTDAWEQRKLGEVADIFDGTHQTPKYTDSGIKFVSVENIATLETEKYISQKAYESEYSNKQAEKGDVLMTRIGNIGTPKLIEKDEPLAYYVTLALLKPKNIDSNFLVWGISSPKVQRNIWKLTLHIAFPKKINLGEINQVSISIPSINEQKKIGDFFKQLDSLIALHQRKLDHLELMKKGLLQQMFV